jgi:hypothetical protein
VEEKDKEEGGKRKWHPQYGEVSRAAAREREGRLGSGRPTNGYARKTVRKDPLKCTAMLHTCCAYIYSTLFYKILHISRN